MYTFSTINDKDFEELTRDLLSKELGKRFQMFKKGKDGGVDLRFSTNSKTNSIIVQAKHLVNSKYSDLIYKLKNEELEKVRKLQPDRYILVTSQNLLPQNKTEIKNIFEPYIKSTQDIYGCEDLNFLLADYKDVELKHYKLWMSSTNVMSKILKNAVLGRSEFSKEQILKKTKVFIPCKAFGNSVDLLNRNNFVLITGEPGIGKTMLANMLSFNLLEKDYELITVYDIKEAEDVFDISKKQVFYFDDFLGANYYDIAIAKNRDSAIVNFIERIISSNNKKLILTTRTVILNKAKKESEKIDDSSLEISKYELKIEDYSRLQKARILYNHIFFSVLDWKTKDVFFNERFYEKIINHRNYSPRIIEHFTEIKKVEKELGVKLDKEEYKRLVLGKLSNPKDVWRKSFENQISDSSRYLLICMLTSQFQDEETIRKIFEARIESEIKKGLKKEFNQFENSMKELLDGFVVRKNNIYDSFNYHSVSFYNPSLGDFLLDYVSNTLNNEIENILDSAIYIEQYTYRFTAKKDNKKGKIFVKKQIIENYFVNNLEKLKSRIYKDEGTVMINGILSFDNLFGFENDNTFFGAKLEEFIKKIKLENISDLDIYKNIEFLEFLEQNKLLENCDELYKLLLVQMSKEMNNLSKFDIFKNQIFRIKISKLDEFLEDVSFVKEIEENIHRVFNDDFENFLIEFLTDKDVLEREDVAVIFKNEQNNLKNFSASLKISIPKIAEKSIDDLVDVSEILYQNNQRNESEEQDASYRIYEEAMQNEKEENHLIEKLFEKP